MRYRDEEGDIGRIKRQQKFMMAVYEKIASAQILTKMPGLVSEIMKMVKTDLPVSDMLAMGGALPVSYTHLHAESTAAKHFYF